MRKLILALALVAMLAVAPALAGEGHKCTAGTQECLNMMAKSMKNRGLIGVDGEWDEAVNGYRIASFIDGSGAEAAGVKAGDLLVAINGIPLTDKEASYADNANRAPGVDASITVVRDGAKHDIAVTLMAMPEDELARYVGHHMLEHAVVTVAQAD